MPQEWFIDDGTGVVGPITSMELQARAADGRLRPTDRVSPDKAKWKPATMVKGLRFGARSPQPPPSAPSPTRPDDPMETLLQKIEASPRPSSGETDTVPFVPGYEILGALGAGACGVVYKARQTALDRVVALKTVQVAGRANPALITRFEKEAVALAKLQHPNIVGVFDCGRRGDQVYFAMELLKGQDLGQRLTDEGALDERTAWAIARQTSAALAHALGEGIYHRDVKPANLFLVPMPTGFGLPSDLPLVKVMDFGLALTRRAGDPATDARLTAAGVVLGTPVYMAPEQFRSPDVDHRADIYALGATVYHALSGEVPFPGTTAWDVMLQKAQGEPPRLGPPVSEESAELVAAMMAPNPDDRVSGYDELIARIDALPVMQGLMPTAGSVDLPPPRRPKPTGLVSTAFFAPPPGGRIPREPGAATTWRWKRLAVGGFAAVLLIVAAIGALAIGGSDGDSRTANPQAPRYQSTKYDEHLFQGQSALGWPGIRGGAVTLEQDDEATPVLTVARGVRRSFAPVPNFRLTLGIDLYQATEADITACIPAGPDLRSSDENAPRLILRVNRQTGAVFGTKAGEHGEFTPLANASAVPFPTPAELEARRPYLAAQLVRIGDVWEAWFHGRKVGTAADDGRPKLPELQVIADGPVRLDMALIEGLAVVSDP